MKANLRKRWGPAVQYLVFLGVLYVFLHAWGIANEYFACVLGRFKYPFPYDKIHPCIVAQRFFLFATPLWALLPFLLHVRCMGKKTELSATFLLLPITVCLLTFTASAYHTRPAIRNHSIWANNKSPTVSKLFDTRPRLDFFTPYTGAEDEVLRTRLIPMIREKLGNSVRIRVANTNSDEGPIPDLVFFASWRYQDMHGDDAEMPGIFLQVHRLVGPDWITLFGLEEIEGRWEEAVERCRSREPKP